MCTGPDGSFLTLHTSIAAKFVKVVLCHHSTGYNRLILRLRLSMLEKKLKESSYRINGTVESISRFETSTFSNQGKP